MGDEESGPEPGWTHGLTPPTRGTADRIDTSWEYLRK
jgi:hypothetical protein